MKTQAPRRTRTIKRQRSKRLSAANHIKKQDNTLHILDQILFCAKSFSIAMAIWAFISFYKY